MFMYGNPLAELERMQREMDSLFTHLGRKTHRFPPVNLYDKEEDIIAEFIIPGLTKEEIFISVENGTLQVKGERKNGIDTEKYEQIREERNAGTFSRTVEIPVAIDVNKVGAELKNGILTITMPKAEEAKPKQISIN